MGTDLQTEPMTVEREWTVEGLPPVLTASVSLPQPTEEGRTARRIRRYYQAQCQAFLRYCERFLLPQAETACRAALSASAPLPCFRAELTYRITYHENGLWSLYTQSREVTGSGRPQLTRRGDTWDLTTGYPMPLSAFFPPKSRWKRDLPALAEADIRRQESAGVARYHKDCHRALRRHFNAQNFYLTEDGLTFFYPMYAIAPAAEGIPSFTVPWSRIQGAREASHAP